MYFNKLWLSKNFFIIAILLSTTVLAEQHHADTLSFKTIQITEHIWMLQGKGGNVALLTGEQILVN